MVPIIRVRILFALFLSKVSPEGEIFKPREEELNIINGTRPPTANRRRGVGDVTVMNTE